MEKSPDANEIFIAQGADGLRAASDNAESVSAEDFGPDDPNGANGANGNEETGSWEAPDLSLLDGPAIPAPAFPIEVLDPFWSAWCVAAAKGANAPVDYTAAALLTTAAALIGNARSITPSTTWEEPCILWTVLVGAPSSGKSPALDPLTKIVSRFEAGLACDFEAVCLTHVANAEMAAQKKERWKATVKAAANDGTAPPLPIDALEPSRPQRPRISITDTTMEAAADIAAANPKGLILIRDELGGWWRAFNRYGGDGERQFWLQAYGARRYTVDRKKLEKPLVIQRLSISILGGAQPDVLAQLLAGEEDGFAARFLYCSPEPVAGFILITDEIDMDGAQSALQRLRDLTLGEDGLAVPRPIKCNLTIEAAERFEEWWRERRSEATHQLGLFGTWLGKAGGLALRLALVLEHLRWCAPGPANSANSANRFPQQIGIDALQSAICLIDEWATPMAQRAFGTAAVPHDEADAAALAGWLKRNCCQQFNLRKLRRSKGAPGGRLSDRQNLKAACLQLAAAGLIRFVGARADNKPGRTRLDYEVNSVLYNH